MNMKSVFKITQSILSSDLMTPNGNAFEGCFKNNWLIEDLSQRWKLSVVYKFVLYSKYDSTVFLVNMIPTTWLPFRTRGSVGTGALTLIWSIFCFRDRYTNHPFQVHPSFPPPWTLTRRGFGRGATWRVTRRNSGPQSADRDRRFLELNRAAGWETEFFWKILFTKIK